MQTQVEARALIRAAESLRDRVLVSLLYGCGLKPGEATRLQWKDVDLESRSLHVRHSVNGTSRELPLPQELVPILAEGVRLGQPEAYLFRGMREGKPLSTGAVGVIVHDLARAAGLEKRVTPMMLRHSYALHSLEAHGNIRVLQEALGHQTIDATMKYMALLAPNGMASSPLDPVPAPLETVAPWEDLVDEDLVPENLDAFLNQEHPVLNFELLLQVMKLFHRILEFEVKGT